MTSHCYCCCCFFFQAFTAATFGLANRTDFASFTVPSSQAAALQTSVDLSFFLRTTQGSGGLLTYIGGDSSEPTGSDTYIMVSLHESLVLVTVYLTDSEQVLSGPQVSHSCWSRST